MIQTIIHTMTRVTSDDGVNFHDIDDIIVRFGKQHLLDLVKCGVYTFESYSMGQLLYVHKFTHKSLKSAMIHTHRGRPLHHICIKTGKIKKQFHGETFRFMVKNSSTRMPFRARIDLCDSVVRIERAFKRYILKKFKDIDMKIDPITCDDIGCPVYLQTDWDMGCKVVFDQNTIEKFAHYRHDIVGFTRDDATGVETDWFRKIYVGLFSPYTRKQFYAEDVFKVPSFLHWSSFD